MLKMVNSNLEDDQEKFMDYWYSMRYTTDFRNTLTKISLDECTSAHRIPIVVSI